MHANERAAAKPREMSSRSLVVNVRLARRGRRGTPPVSRTM
jgi:hypothetical protein